MIPLALLVGLLVGRWMIVPGAAAAWMIILQLTGTCDWGCSGTGLGLAAANTGFGVGVHQLIDKTRRGRKS